MLLKQQCTHLKKEYPLGDIAGAPNGTSTVLYEKFTQPYPDWLLCLKNALQYSGKVVLNNRVTHRSAGIISSWEIVLSEPDTNVRANNPIKMMHHSDQSITLSEAVKFSEPGVAVIGDSTVALALIEQLKLLPVRILWLSEEDHSSHSLTVHHQKISDDAIDTLPENIPVAIATKSHELDIQCCYRALRNKQSGYVGCLGSTRKSSIVKKRLKEMGMTEQHLQQLTMPIGLPGITGKQPAIIAASIVAQLLSMHDDYFSI